MEVLSFSSQLHQAFSFEIVVWDSKLLRQSNWWASNCALFPPGPSIVKSSSPVVVTHNTNISSCSVIVRVSVVLKRTVGDSD